MVPIAALVGAEELPVQTMQPQKKFTWRANSVPSQNRSLSNRTYNAIPIAASQHAPICTISFKHQSWIFAQLSRPHELKVPLLDILARFLVEQPKRVER